MVKAALIGKDISYTRSPEIHAAIADALGVKLAFEVVDTPIDMFDTRVEELFGSVDGFFVTKPYKNEIKRHLKSVTTECGVNFVTCKDKTGYNTDGIGFVKSLDKAFGSWRADVASALVLGAGGAAHSVAEALVKAGKHVYVLNRTVMTAAKLCSSLGENCEIYLNQPVELAVNCTSVGLNGEDALAALCVLPSGFKYAYDLIYAPPVTPFLRRCGESGAATCNGRDMLVYQAIEGDKLLLGRDFDTDEVFAAVDAILNGGK